MSLRPAQALVAESSKFSLRTLFEAKAAAEPASMPLPLPLAPPGVAGQASATASSAGVAPASSPPLPPLSTLPKIATKEHNKFTFNGLVMPSSAQNASSPTPGRRRLAHPVVMQPLHGRGPPRPLGLPAEPRQAAKVARQRADVVTAHQPEEGAGAASSAASSAAASRCVGCGDKGGHSV